MFCPVCNGIKTLHESCLNCEGEAMDYGQLSDFVGPYSPYVEFEDEHLLNITINNTCKHLIYCPACKQTTEILVKEWQ